MRQSLRDSALLGEVTESRFERMLDVAVARIGTVTIVMENLFDPHNVAAIVRSAEGLGIDEVHVVEDPHPYRAHRAILHGADRWLQIERHDRLEPCLATLQQQGYLTCAADVGPGCIVVDELPVEEPLAVVFGSERHGLTQRARTCTDVRFTIPMAGFTGSFNVSVSAAITLHHLTSRRRQWLDAVGDLSLEQMKARVQNWLRQTVVRRGHIRSAAGRPVDAVDST